MQFMYYLIKKGFVFINYKILNNFVGILILNLIYLMFLLNKMVHIA